MLQSLESELRTFVTAHADATGSFPLHTLCRLDGRAGGGSD